jgi:hypothetical protein
VRCRDVIVLSEAINIGFHTRDSAITLIGKPWIAVPRAAKLPQRHQQQQ